MKFIIVDGSFRDSDNSIKGPGDTIELDEDMAKLHGNRVRPALAEDEAEKPAAAAAEAVQAPALATADPAYLDNQQV